MDAKQDSKAAADGKTGGATPDVYSPASIEAFAKAFAAECEKRKLEPDPRVAAGARAGASEGKTSVLNLEAKRSMIVKSAPVSNDQLAALVEVLVSTYPNAFRAVNLSHNGVDDKLAGAFATLLMKSRSLEALNLNGNAFGRLGCNSLTQTLMSNSGLGLRSLSLRNNPIGDEAVKGVAKFLRLNPALTDLDVGNVGASTQGLVHLASAIGGNTRLSSLNIDRPRVEGCDEETTVHLAKALRTNRSLERLSMAKHCLKSYGTMWLMEYVSTWNQGSVKFLDIGSNQIDAEGAKYIAKALASGDCAVEELILRANRLTDEGAIAIAAAIKKNTSLTKLDLSFTSLADAGLVALANALVGNVTLKTLLLGGNKFGPGAKKAWQGVLGWPVAEGAAKGSSLDVSTLDFIPLMAPL